MAKKIILIILVLIIIGGGAFYGGMKYGQSKSPLSGISRQNFQNQANVRGNGRGTVANFLSGEVISKDEQSLTLKMPARQNFVEQNLGGPDGGSKIIFFSTSTAISKMTDGSINDIEIGKQIMVSGQQNSDGSYTAKTIQLSPRYPTP